MAAITAWTCPSCESLVSTPFCPTCGERALHSRELTVGGLADQVSQSFLKIDGRLLRSLGCLVAHPGLLTVAYLRGRRKPYLPPVGLFLFANVVFFASESLTRGAVFSTPLESHLHTQPWSDVAGPLIAQRLEAMHTTVTAYAPRFDTAVALHARSLILLMALSFTALPAIIFGRSGRPFVTHAVFSLHLYGFLLLLFSAATTIPAFGLLWGGVRSTSEALDHAISLSLLALCATYLYCAIRVVYGGSRIVRGVQSSVLTFGVAAIVLGYRFVLMLITLYST